ncbi:nuclease-related domain-containing protein [Rummeliibacillus stabekisii]
MYGGKDRKTWVINGEFKMRNPLFQNYGHIQAIKNNVNEKYYNNFISSVN